ncbi:MAG: hypothetical protein ACHQF2_11845, partial [Flavobacteriales bacterium]
MAQFAHIFLLIVLALSTFQAEADHPDGPLMDHQYQILKYRESKNDTWKKPPRFYSMTFKGHLVKGYIRMNTCHFFHSSYEVDYKSNIKFDDTAVLSSDPYTFCEIAPVKAFEKAYALLLPKMKRYVKSDDTLVLKGRDGSEIQLVRFGQLKKRLQHTWYSSKDTNAIIEIRGDKWIFRTRGMPIIPLNVYTFEAIDDKWMDGNWNRVIDYAKLTNSNRTIEYYFIH